MSHLDFFHAHFALTLSSGNDDALKRGTLFFPSAFPFEIRGLLIAVFKKNLLPKMEIKSENIELMTNLLKSYGRVLAMPWPSHDQVIPKS